MPEYRIYTIGIDGHFIGREALVCDSDDAAAEEARRELDVHTVEVWCGTVWSSDLRHDRRAPRARIQ
jgi:hypothetical protein